MWSSRGSELVPSLPDCSASSSSSSSSSSLSWERTANGRVSLVCRRVYGIPGGGEPAVAPAGSRRGCNPPLPSAVSSARRCSSSSSCGAPAWPRPPPPPRLPPPVSATSSSSRSNKLPGRQQRTLFTLSSSLWRRPGCLTHCIWFWSAASSSGDTCPPPEPDRRGWDSTAASGTPSGRRRGSAPPAGRCGGWSGTSSLCIWGERFQRALAFA